MFAFFDQVPTSTSLLLQCGYRSKACTNHRATKLDGTLHKLCEFHRRKANLNQQRLHKRQREQRLHKRQREQRLHKRQREQRAARQMCEPVENRSIKKAHPSLEPVVDPIFPFKHEFGTSGYNEYCPLVGAGGPSLAKIWAPDMDFLEQLLDDMQSMPPLDDTNSFIV